MAKLILKRDDGSAQRFQPDSIDSRPAPAANVDFLRQVNSVQHDAVTAISGPVLIVAGAGSGKTRVLTYRIAYLLATGVKPWNVLALTFTNKAAAEMKERIGVLVGPDQAAPLWMGTFHSMFSRILRREAGRLGYTSSFTIYDTDDSLAVVRAAMSQFGVSQQDFQPKSLLNRISGAKNAMVTPAALRAATRNRGEEQVALVYESYENRLRQNNAMDFDDLLVKTIKLFEEAPEVLERYQQQFQHVLIDEYQDTNRAQYLVVQMLARAHRNICVVGDDAQSIYRFRGADIRNMLDFERDYPDHRIFRLEQNYRSTKTIIAAADDVIRNNRQQIPKSLWTANDVGEPIKVLTLRDEREEGEEVARIIQRERRAGTALGEIAILYRTNSQSLSIEDALRRQNIPYGIVGAVAFYRRKEVKDALAYLRLVVNPRDDESFLRAVNTPARGIGEVTVKRLRAFAVERGIPLLEAARQAESIQGLAPRIATTLQRFAGVVTVPEQAELVPRSPYEIAHAVIGEAGILASYHEEGTPEAGARLDNVERVLSHIAEYSDNNPEGTLDTYLQEISLLSEVDNFDASVDRVTLMTVHSAKGLEFDVVMVTGMEEGLFPVGNSATDEEDLEEERRLFYVAVTRARRRLFLVNCERRYRFGELSYPTQSRFLNEIRAELLEHSVNGASIRPSTGLVRRPERRTDGAQRRPAAPPVSVEQESPDDDYSQVPRTLQVGSRVTHPSFGSGRIEMVVGSGDKTKVTVRFDSVGRKQLMLKFANLRVL